MSMLYNKTNDYNIAIIGMRLAVGVAAGAVARCAVVVAGAPPSIRVTAYIQ